MSFPKYYNNVWLLPSSQLPSVTIYHMCFFAPLTISDLLLYSIIFPVEIGKLSLFHQNSVGQIIFAAKALHNL